MFYAKKYSKVNKNEGREGYKYRLLGVCKMIPV